MIDPDAAMTFLGFVEQRHAAYVARQRGDTGPWSADPLVQTHKFTNVFRLLDYGSQFVITDLLEEGLDPRDRLARLFLYRHTNLPASWQFAEMELGRYPLVADLDDVLEIWKTYRGGSKAHWSGSTTPGGEGSWGKIFQRKVFSGAYMVFPQSQVKGTDKLESIIDLTKRLFTPGGPQDAMPAFLAARDQRGRFAALRGNKGVADFMSMQILTDWGYGTEFREDQFVVPGPGARKGAAALDPRAKAESVIEWAVHAMRRSPGCPHLGGRPPSYMDVQNTLCEFSKYVRFAQKPLPSKPYKPAHPGPQPAPVLPRHW